MDQRSATQHGLGPLEESLIIKEGRAMAIQEDRNLIFIFNMDILLVNVPFSF